MTEQQKRTFIHDLCDSVRNELLSKTLAMPEDWDGRELRELIADTFERCRMPSLNKHRRKAYRNEVLVRNL